MRKLYPLFLLSLLIAACGAIPAAVQPEVENTAQEIPAKVESTSIPLSSTDLGLPASSTLDSTQINPRAPELGEYSFNQLLPFDGIRPVYDPKFARKESVQDLLEQDELIIGISLGDEAKAYPISVLRFREMVNDEMAGIPTLVTW
jgi:hypothetical protein